MTKDDIKALGLQARAFKASRRTRLTRPSNELLYLWFVSKAQIARKSDIQAFDAWLRSTDGLEPYPSPTGLQNSTLFPYSLEARDADDPCSIHDLYLANVEGKLWAVTVHGHLKLQAEAHRLP